MGGHGGVAGLGLGHMAGVSLFCSRGRQSDEDAGSVGACNNEALFVVQLVCSHI